MARLLLPAVTLALAACAPSTRAPTPVVDTTAVEECRDFAEQTVPHEPVRGNGGGGRSTVYRSYRDSQDTNRDKASGRHEAYSSWARPVCLIVGMGFVAMSIWR